MKSNHVDISETTELLDSEEKLARICGIFLPIHAIIKNHIGVR